MQKLKQLKSLNQAGDTIVEVMVVLAILGLALSISYATANRSLLDARQAQENSIATELAQSQIESLVALAPSTSTVFSTATYCISNNAVVSSADSNYVTDCQQQQSLYNMTIASPNPSDSSGGTFTVTVTWPDVEGQGNDTVVLLYRLYPPSS